MTTDAAAAGAPASLDARVGSAQRATMPEAVAPGAMRGSSGDVVLALEGVTKRYGRHLAVDDVTFDVRRGELFGLLGPNGAGKTTTFGLLMGLVRPTAGRVTVLGRPANDVVAVHREVGAMLEHPAFHPGLTARANLVQLARLHGRRALARVEEVLEIVDLARRAHDRVGTFSQGMKQRLALAAALLHDPLLLLLDEPTNGLDPEGSESIWTLLRALARERGKTVVVSSHLLHEVEAGCDRVAVLRRGRIVACELVADLLRGAAAGARSEAGHGPDGRGGGWHRVRLGFADEARAHRAARCLGDLGGQGTTLEPPTVHVAGRGLGACDWEIAWDPAVGMGGADLVARLVGAEAAPDAVVPVTPTLKDLFLGMTDEP